MLTIWGRFNAYNVQKVVWALEETGQDYRRVDIGHVAGDLDTDEFRAINPNGRIPVIKDADLYVWESNTILRYLASKYDTTGLWTNDVAERTFIERWMDWELATWQPDFLGLFWSYYRTPEKQRDKKQIEYYHQRCASNLDILQVALGNNQYIAADRFTLADACIATAFYRYLGMGREVCLPDKIDNWYKRITERPAYQKSIMLPFDELKGRLEF